MDKQVETQASPRPTAYGRRCYPGGRTVEITSPHQEWTDYAAEAVNEREALLACERALRALADTLDEREDCGAHAALAALAAARREGGAL